MEDKYKLTWLIEIRPSNKAIKPPPKGMKELKQLPNGLLEDSRGRKYWIYENGSLRRLK